MKDIVQEYSLPKILVVDDDTGILTQMKWALSDEYEVLLSSTKQGALEIIKEKKPEIIALDINLDGERSGNKEGIEILEELKVADALSKVIMITGDDTKEAALEAVRLGAFDYYTKPIAIEELKVIFKRALYLRRLEEENRHLLEELHQQFSFKDIVGNSEKMHEVFKLMRRVAPTEATVLITGESGTGKELVAKAIHYLSSRKDKPFVVINCGAIPENLLESELFGHEKGSFTDAHSQRTGKLECAHQGTIFLDEIGEMSLSLQVKILRFLQERVIERVGANTPLEVDVRIIVATNSDLNKKMQEGRFREDLYYRLSVINLELPPLRERGEDILLLANYFLHKYKREMSREDIQEFTKDAKDLMKSYRWPGNVREMENKLKRAVILAQGSLVSSADLGFRGPAPMDTVEKLSLRKARQQLEASLIRRALDESKGNVTLASKMLGVTRPTLYDLIKKYHIRLES